jgi:hypothetical protein
MVNQGGVQGFPIPLDVTVQRRQAVQIGDLNVPLGGNVAAQGAAQSRYANGPQIVLVPTSAGTGWLDVDCTDGPWLATLHNTGANEGSYRLQAGFGQPPADLTDGGFWSRYGNLYLPGGGTYFIRAPRISTVGSDANISVSFEPVSGAEEARMKMRPILQTRDPITGTASGTAATFLTVDLRREYLLIENRGANRIDTNLRRTAVSGQGYGILSAGKAIEFMASRGDLVPTYAISLIAPSGSSAFSILAG